MSENKKICIFGTGGHGKVVLSLCQALDIEVKAFFDSDPNKVGTNFCGVPVHHQDTAAEVLASSAFNAHIAIGSNAARSKIAARFADVAKWPVLIHPLAFVDRTAQVGEGSMIGIRAILMPYARVGKHTIINSGALIEHDNDIGSYVHIAPANALAGTVTVGDGTFIGIGARVIPGLTIGKNVVVGAGATVIRSIPDGQTWVGTPARQLR